MKCLTGSAGCDAYKAAVTCRAIVGGLWRSSRGTSAITAFPIDGPDAYYRRGFSLRMSYYGDKLRALPVALLVLAIFIALPNSLTDHWGDATYVSLFCL